MLVKIKMNAGKEYKNDNYNNTLISLRGQWVEIDTTHLFKDQYNLKDYDLRVFDTDIEAVKDDERKNRVGCGYCGKQFDSIEELKAHYLEEENKINHCEGCFYYQKYIKDTQRTTEKSINENGEEVEKHTTVYTWGRKCEYKEGCTHNEHRKHKFTIFTPENTYFLKYPNGYAAYFKSLPLTDQWKECGFTYENNIAIMKNYIGSYCFSIHYNKNGIASVHLTNSRKAFTIPSEEFYRIMNSTYNFHYLFKFDDNGNEKENVLKDFPKSILEELFKTLDCLRDECRNKDYKNELILAKSPV